MEELPDTDYPVLVTRRGGIYDLRIRELLLIVRSADLQSAYEEVIARKREVIVSAQAVGAVDELPSPDWPPLLGRDVVPSGALSRLRCIWKRMT